MTETLAAGDFPAWESQVSAAGACSHPIRLTGKVQAVNLATGETAEVFKTWTDVPYIDGKGELDTWRDDSPLHVACGNRREAVCPACSAVYKRDARQLVRAGLAGGKGVPESVAAHPCVFATLTAPSFGPVHARRERGGKVLPCRPRRDRNQAGVPAWPGYLLPGPPRRGRSAAWPPDVPRLLRLPGRGAVQRGSRGAVAPLRHLPAAPPGPARRRHRQASSASWCGSGSSRSLSTRHAASSTSTRSSGSTRTPTTAMRRRLLGGRLICCADAIKLAAAQASALAPVAGTAGRCCCGSAPRLTPGSCASHQGDELTRDAVANYIAKYATKTADAPGLPSSRIRSVAEIQALRCPAHHRRMIETAWQLGHRKWAHMLGYGGHFLTKSRRYSVTFGQLRAARAAYRRAQRYEAGQLDPWGRPVDETTVLFLGSWTYAGSGYAASDGQLLALMSADSARER